MLCAISLLFFVVRNLADVVFGSHLGPYGHALAILAGTVAFGAVYLLSGHDTTPLQGLREAIEALLIAGGLCITAWVAFLGDLVLQSTRSAAEEITLVASAMGAASISAYAFLVLLRTPSGRRASLASYAAGTFAIAIGELVHATGLLRATIPGSSNHSGWTSATCSAIGFALFALGATQPTTVPESRMRSSRGSRLRWTLWLLPSSLALAFALPRLRPGTEDPTLLTIAGVVIAVHLVHQWLMVVENRGLVDELDSRVEERTRELASREDYYRGLFEHSTDIVAVVGADCRFRDHTPSLTAVLGWRPEDLEGVLVEDLLIGLGAHEALRAYRRIFAGASRFEAVYDRLLHVDGTWRDVEIQLANHLEDPSVRGVIATTRDITERLRLENELAHQAFHDPLTGLANRTLFRTAVERSIEIAGSHGETVSVLLLDLDGFKAVNDSLGHPAGDQLLVVFADRLRRITRVEDTLARLGGDEFAVLVEPGVDPETIAGGIVKELFSPFVIDGALLHLSASIGIAGTSDASSFNELLRNADVAMYEAKQHHSRSWVCFDPAMRERSLRRLQLLTDLRLAVERNEFEVHLQPIVELGTGQVRGFEALARWSHPTEGLLFPADFIPLAEESGLIDAIGDLILRRAVADVAPVLVEKDWYLSVNISARQLDSPQLLATTEELLRTTGLPPRLLVLEITESAVMSDPEAAGVRLGRLAAAGIRIALDDFGTGYSSLAVLSKFPLDVLKVDRSFVLALEDDAPSASALLSAIDEIGRALDLVVIAEGIETPEERTSLGELGYRYGQGYLFSAPLPVGEALAWAENAQRGSLRSGATTARTG